MPGPVAPRGLPPTAAIGWVLAEALVAPGPLPAAPVAARDGWAVASADTAGAAPYAPLPLPGAPAWVEAGENLPAGADAVLTPFEVDAAGPFANERDYGQEAIEILLQVMENCRGDLVMVLAGYADRMNRFSASNPGFRSRVAHYIDFPDYDAGELMAIAEPMLSSQSHRFSPAACGAFARYLEARMRQPHFANARSVRNALDRARLRQAVRLFERRGQARSPRRTS